MRLLLDTQIIVWLLTRPDQLRDSTLNMLRDPQHLQWFSSASIWELAIKQRLNRADTRIDAGQIYASLIASTVEELPVSSLHGLQTRSLPLLHDDPFDRILLAQAMSEDLTLVTADKDLAQYDGPILKVQRR